MRTVRQARMVLNGTRARIYEIDLVDLANAKDARYLVNFRYGWQGAVLEEGTRTPNAVTEAEAIRIFESLILARQNQGYVAPDVVAPTAKAPVVAVVGEGEHPRDAILAARLRTFDALPDLKAAGLLRRVGELRMMRLGSAVVAAGRSLLVERNRLAALRTLPYALHRIDDGSGLVSPLLEKLSTCVDVPTAETALMLRAVRDGSLAPGFNALPLVLSSAAGLPDAEARDAATRVYFLAATTSTSSMPNPAGGWDTSTKTAAGALRALYVRGAHDAVARSMVLTALSSALLQPPLFIAIRRIWQVAEATDDAEVFALLLARFDDERSKVQLGYSDASGQRRAVIGGQFVTLRAEGAKPNARVAYASPTRTYLRRRGWRTLRRLGRDGDPAYVAMAVAVLLTLDDARWAKPSEDAVLVGTAPAVQPHRVDAYAPEYQDRYAAHHIMHGAHDRVLVSPMTLRWRFRTPPGQRAMRREERFPELWDRHPEALWRLAVNARAGIVVGFAARGLAANTAFIDTIPTSDIARLLLAGKSSIERRHLAIMLAERRISVEGLKPDLAAALMSDEDRGGALVKLYLGGRSEFLATAPDVFAATLLGCAAGNHAWFEAIAQKAADAATPAVRADVLARVIAGVQAAPEVENDLPRARLLARLVTRLFPAEIVQLDGDVLRRLSQSDRDPARVVAAILASARPDGARLVDVAALAQSTNPELRAAGISLFAQRPLDDLVADLDAVAAFLSADAKEPREAARPIAESIGRERPDAARALAEKLLPAIYRAEDHEGLREDVYQVLSKDLRGGVIALGSETTWTLLRARAEPARRLGADVLDGFTATDFSIRQLARIGCNDQVKARRWALAQLHARIEDVRAEPEAGFALLDCAFEDARDAGYALYRGELKPEDWTGEALVALSDSITEPAQRFGREMIGKVFEAKNADVLLGRLAEHPAPGFRLLVARLMRDYVKDDTQRLRQLVPTIESTLLQVRKSRAAKDQVFAFIAEQLEASADGGGERLAILAPVLERSVATCATADRARALSLLASIKHKNPDLAPRAVILPREARR